MLLHLQSETLKARERTQDEAISTRAANGRVQVIRATYPNGKGRPASIEPLSGWITPDEAIAFLAALGR